MEISSNLPMSTNIPDSRCSMLSVCVCLPWPTLLQLLIALVGCCCLTARRSSSEECGKVIKDKKQEFIFVRRGCNQIKVRTINFQMEGNQSRGSLF